MQTRHWAIVTDHGGSVPAAKKPRWEPTKEQLAQMEFLAGFDWPHDRLARFFGVSGSTFRRAHKKNAAMRDVLLRGKELINAHLLESTFEMARSKKFPAINIFLCKVRLGFKEQKEAPPGGLLNENAPDQKKADEVVNQFKGLLEEFQRIPKSESQRVDVDQSKNSNDPLPGNEGGNT